MESFNLSGPWHVVKVRRDGVRETIESDLSEEVARQMVEDYRAEGETVWMERTTPESE